MLDLCGGTDPAPVTVAAATILDTCVHVAEWLREDGRLGIDQLEDRWVAMALRIAGAA